MYSRQSDVQLPSNRLCSTKEKQKLRLFTKGVKKLEGSVGRIGGGKGARQHLVEEAEAERKASRWGGVPSRKE